VTREGLEDFKPLFGLMVSLPIRTISEGNAREHFRAVAKRKHEHRRIAHMALGAALAKRGLAGLDFVPVLVTLTRIGPRTLDSDNVAFALKATRDGIADALGIDDGDRDRLRFRYRQRRAGPKVWSVEVLIERATAET
jgi:hypothetical protein